MNTLLHLMLSVIGTVDQQNNGWLLVETASEEGVAFCHAHVSDILVGTGKEGTLVVVTRCIPEVR